MPRPAHELLNPASPVKPAWAVFDAPWYLRHYADARAMCAGKPPEAALLYYLRVGASWVRRLSCNLYIFFEKRDFVDCKRTGGLGVLVRWNIQFIRGLRHIVRSSERICYLY